ncbi:DUF861 domain-containing protein [Alicycliphilus denitrificans]|uniref:(S)-ureidoglycine aminohydrolase cupin domain-containing protein n=2 Tax=Alicycliphilus denitrificans TaxID=179636 RepID=F4GCF2_ALIDK|nr:cupin domain-containing protein [Alicycliphilus denitrificans]ADU99133.1 protein of unknown function DUF861 cupin_3 [Alicycliphilus denitrificans BC]AEB85884.1 protein of unknown function DUF861 cupin_3 [Alicycliphilus denitrificans K601]QKD43430.1 DUF861 domain-containing protein [Alicycliphilus denitrificans]GAO27268.1 hypothetical protein ALISP_7088 [Alicycliphilus sp. B1]
MGIQVIAQSATTPQLQDWGPVTVPLSTPACALRGLEVRLDGRPDSDMGLWECSPGRFQRQVASGEVMHILAGAGRFMPEAEGAAPVEFRAGDTLFFPPDTRGVWEIRETVRKLYVMV